ncbi:MAG: HAMP domain-containing protein [Anaerolineales bacterium]|nr:MAG: HAMP domain-containing protein [Anaerolineales bacterium]
MSLRARLTIFFTFLVGIVLVLFGVAVYAQVNSILYNQINQKLESAVLDTSQVLRATDQGNFALTTFLSYDKSLILQLWSAQGGLIDAAQTSILKLGNASIDPVGLKFALDDGVDSLREVFRNDAHFQVKTNPLYVGDGSIVGALQVGTSLMDVDKLLNDLRQALVFTGITGMGIAALVGWLTTNQALSPIATVTKTASEITRADDLSRRIPNQSNQSDEVGQLIQAFNQTLERLEELFYSQRRFIADVGHELRTPLTVIKGNADLMRRVGTMDEQSLDSMDKEIERLTRMVGDLLLLAQAESGKLPLDLQVVELDTILLEVCQQALVLAEDKKEIRIGEIDQVLVCGDQDRLKQVVLNLVSNAVKYTQDGGIIEVRLGKRDSLAYLAVEDNGPGIPEEDLGHIFERFFRAEKSRSRSTKDDGKGFGLGLSIAYWIVHNHGGKIEVESVVGEGTTFTVRLPLADEECQGESRETSLTAVALERTN